MGFRFAKAVRRDQVTLHYQPIVSLRSGTIVAAEALLRWHTEAGWHAPESFLPHLQGTRHADALDRFVVGTAVEQARKWESSGHALQVTVNLSPTSLNTAFVEEIEASLRHAALPPRLLHVEIVELQDDGAWLERVAALHELRELGVSVSIDDFGRGESSLSRLVDLPLDVLKIDRSFVAAMIEDRRSAGVVRNSMELAHTLEMSAVGEGVETPSQWHRLRAWGCDYAQGFLISEPLAAADFMPALANEVIPILDRLGEPPDFVERRAGPRDRRGRTGDRRRGAALWPRPVHRNARR